MPRGQAFLKEWEQRLLDDRESVVVTCRCYFCSWQETGTVRDTREAYAEHRRLKHPEVQPATRRKRHRPWGQLATGTRLDDNIEKARAQGAAGWAGPSS